MSFIIQGLEANLFGSLSDQTQDTFNGRPVERHLVTESPGFPCRITLDDAEVGQTVFLLSYEHHCSVSPYAQSGPIFLTVSDSKRGEFVDSIPPALARRTLSLRAYDMAGSMIDAIIVEGREAKAVIDQLFSNADVVGIDAHNASRGCFAAHVTRHGA